MPPLDGFSGRPPRGRYPDAVTGRRYRQLTTAFLRRDQTRTRREHTQAIFATLLRARESVSRGQKSWTKFRQSNIASNINRIDGRYVLEGSVQRGGNRMRVNVQLIDAETGNHLWAERFDKPLADLFDMQDEIVARLAGALNAQLVAAEARRAEQAPTPELDGPLFSRFGLAQ